MVISTGMPMAVACVEGIGGLQGTVKFYPIPGGCLVMAEVVGLPKNETGFYGFHIHEGRSCGGAEFSETKGHFSPGGGEHPRHTGDLPPLLSDNGRAFLAVKTSRFAPCDIIGRTVVIHEEAEDFHSQPGGNAGQKIACGVIRRI